MTEEPMSSSRRIQLLRERLEMYNATIAEAMGVVAGVANVDRGTAPTNKTGANQHADEIGNNNKESAPRLERDLAAEFSEARTFSDASRRFEKRTTPPPPSPLMETKTRKTETTTRLEPEALASSHSSTSSLELDSSTVFSESDGGSSAPPHLNEQVLEEGDAEFAGMPGRSKEQPHLWAATSKTQGNGTKNTNPIALSSRSCSSEEQITPKPSVLPPKQQQQKEHGECQQQQEGKKEEAGEGEKIDVEFNEGKNVDEGLSFASLETAYYRLTLAEQALQKLTGTLDIDVFPRSLPQQKHALQLADARDALLQREQELRRRGTTGVTLKTIYETSAVGVAKQVRQLLTDCGAAQSLFARVHERRAAVSVKEELLKRRLGELAARQRETTERREALATLQRRTEQREAQLQQREANYRRELDAHRAREQALKARLGEVEALGRRTASWIKILDERDAATAAKERRLRRVQADLVRRSEELLCCRNGRSPKYTQKQDQNPNQEAPLQQPPPQTRASLRQASSP